MNICLVYDSEEQRLDRSTVNDFFDKIIVTERVKFKLYDGLRPYELLLICSPECYEHLNRSLETTEILGENGRMKKLNQKIQKYKVDLQDEATRKLLIKRAQEVAGVKRSGKSHIEMCDYQYRLLAVIHPDTVEHLIIHNAEDYTEDGERTAKEDEEEDAYREEGRVFTNARESLMERLDLLRDVKNLEPFFGELKKSKINSIGSIGKLSIVTSQCDIGTLNIYVQSVLNVFVYRSESLSQLSEKLINENIQEYYDGLQSIDEKNIEQDGFAIFVTSSEMYPFIVHMALSGSRFGKDTQFDYDKIKATVNCWLKLLSYVDSELNAGSLAIDLSNYGDDDRHDPTIICLLEALKLFCAADDQSDQSDLLTRSGGAILSEDDRIKLQKKTARRTNLDILYVCSISRTPLSVFKHYDKHGYNAYTIKQILHRPKRLSRTAASDTSSSFKCMDCKKSLATEHSLSMCLFIDWSDSTIYNYLIDFKRCPINNDTVRCDLCNVFKKLLSINMNAIFAKDSCHLGLNSSYICYSCLIIRLSIYFKLLCSNCCQFANCKQSSSVTNKCCFCALRIFYDLTQNANLNVEYHDKIHCSFDLCNLNGISEQFELKCGHIACKLTQDADDDSLITLSCSFCSTEEAIENVETQSTCHFLVFDEFCPNEHRPSNVVTSRIKPIKQENDQFKISVKYLDDSAIIQIGLFVPDGIQGGEDPKPGESFVGFMKSIFLPNNAAGKNVCELIYQVLLRDKLKKIHLAYDQCMYVAHIDEKFHLKYNISDLEDCDETYLLNLEQNLSEVLNSNIQLN